MSGSVQTYMEQNKDKLFDLRKSGMYVKDIAKLYGLNQSTLSGFFAKNKILIRKNLTAQDKIEIVERYKSGEALHKLGRFYHVADSKILEIIREFGEHVRNISEAKQQYSLNENYFDVIDHQNKAYIIGLLLADGSRSANSYQISLSLQASDLSVLQKINTELGSNRKIVFRELSKKHPTYSDQYSLCIVNKRLSISLEQFGITPKKDFTVKFPEQINQIYYRHVIRGLFDGDGFISKTENRCGITGNKELVEFLAKHIHDVLNIHCSISTPHRGKATRDLRISGRRQVKKFLDYIYDGSELYIERKYQTYQDMYCHVETNQSCA